MCHVEGDNPAVSDQGRRLTVEWTADLFRIASGPPPDQRQGDKRTGQQCGRASQARPHEKAVRNQPPWLAGPRASQIFAVNDRNPRTAAGC